MDIAKGIGIALVVFGHSDLLPDIKSPESYIYIKRIIYVFHMPLFFVISGYLLVSNINIADNLSDYYSFVKKKSAKLLLPYMSISIGLIVIKLIGRMFTHIQYPVDRMSFYNLFLQPDEGAVMHLWFVYVLFMMYVTVPLSYKVSHNINIVMAGSLLLLLFAWPSVFELNNLLEHLPFFIGGIIFYRYDLLNKCNPYIALFSLLIVFIAGVSLMNMAPDYWKLTYWELSYSYKIIKTVTSLSGACMVIFVSIIIVSLNDCLAMPESILRLFGIYSASIYFLHTFFLGAVKVFIVRIMHVDTSFWLPMTVKCLAGLLLPVIFEKYILDRTPLIRKYLIGVSKPVR
ncbi:MAG: acyltransferase family protein [Nitrospirae bacterium]|nr:acyltransferase family protein [Nitrospirota bacterium]